MQRLNETGKYDGLFTPGLFRVGSLSIRDSCPCFPTYQSDNSVDDKGYQIVSINEFLCREVYGCQLNGTYQYGKDFSIQYNVQDALRNDPLTADRVKEDSYRLEFADKTYGTSPTTVYFSNHQWEWRNEKDEIINHGIYQESQQYYGLIEMYLDAAEKEEKKSAAGQAAKAAAGSLLTSLQTAEGTNSFREALPPVMIYIVDNQIYFPGYVREKT